MAADMVVDLIAIEQGSAAFAWKSCKACELYGVSVNALLRTQAIHVDLTPKFRKLVETATKPAAPHRSC